MQFIENSNFEIVDEDYINTIKRSYDYCGVDYVRLKLKGTYEGLPSHRAAAICAMRKILFDFNEFRKNLLLSKIDDTIDETKMNSIIYPLCRFFAKPEWLIKDAEGKDKGKVWYGNPCEVEQYAYAFCSAPLSPSKNEFLEDWETVNNVLFPNRNRLIIYSWNDDWQEFYFSAGKEYWGCFFWTVFDPDLNLFTIVAASNTD